MLSWTTFGQQKTILTGENIPPTIRQFSAAYFKNETILKVVKEQDGDKIEYEVKYSNRIEVEFDGNFRLKEVEANKGVPEALVPTLISSKVIELYPKAIIKEIDFEEDGSYKVKLNNKVILFFNPNKELIQ